MIVVAALLTAPAIAQGTDAVTEARRHYDLGNKAFNVGEFGRAIAEFKRAYSLKADPVLLFNIGQAYRLSNEPERAVFFYRSYLRDAPDAPNRREVEERIRVLEEQIAGPTRAGADAGVPGAAGTGGAVAGTGSPSAVPPAGPPALGAAAPTTPPPAPTLAATPGAAPAPTPLYKQWWLWTAVGAVAAVVVVGALAFAGGAEPPASDFPVQPFPK